MFVVLAIEYLFASISLFYAFYLLLFLKLIRFKAFGKPTYSGYPKVSILICAKNEAKNLALHLPKILEQEYPHFEVVVVNDQSTDNTLDVLEKFQKECTLLKIFTTPGKSSKKKALQFAKEKANGDVFLLTDSDCYPASRQWIKFMVAQLDYSHQVCLGYGAYSLKKGWLSKLQRYETLTTAMQYFTFTLLGFPYMGVGRNLAYTAILDKNIAPNNAYYQSLSGDDDLFIQEAKKHTLFKIQLDQRSFTYSEAPESLSSWWHQKRRHISAASYYTLKDKIMLSLVFFIKFSFWTIFILSLFFSPSLLIFSCFFSLISLLTIIYYFASRKLNEPKIFWFSSFLDFGLNCFLFCVFIANLVSPIKKWK